MWKNWFKKDALKNDPTVVLLAPRPGKYHWMAAIGAILLIAAGFLWMAGKLIDRTNPEPQRQDQKHNMRRALIAAQPDDAPAGRMLNWMPHRTDGVVAPLWPWVASKFSQPGHAITEETFATDSPEDLDFFRKGKWVNVGISLAFLVLLGLAAARKFTVLGTVNLCLLAGFGVLLPRAVYFQPEPLFYIFFFLAWVCAIQLLKKNTLWLHGLFGFVCGLAYLSKTSIEPLILGWLGVTAYRFVASYFRREANPTWTRAHHFLGLLCFAFAYFFVIGPTLLQNKQQYGSLFHNYPRYWMWMDDFDNEGYQWMRDHQTKESLQAIPADQVPSFSNYRRTHTGEQMWNRLSDGTYLKLEQLLAPKTEFKKPKDGWKRILDLRGAYFGWLLVMLALAWVQVKSRGKILFEESPPLHRESGTISLFVAGTFTAYALAYGWYHVIGRGERFMLGLYLTLVFSVLWAAEWLHKWACRRGGGSILKTAYTCCHAVLTAAILWRLLVLVRDLPASGGGVWFDPRIM